MEVNSNKLGKLSLLGGILLIFLGLGGRYVLEGWVPFIFLCLGLGAILICYFLYSQRQHLKSVLGYRASEKDLTLGVRILALVLLTFLAQWGASYLDSLYDWSRSGQHRITEATKSILTKLPVDSQGLQWTILHRGPQDREALRKVEAKLNYFEQAYRGSQQVQIINIYEKPQLAQKQLSAAGMRTIAGLFMSLNCSGRNMTVNYPFTEVELAMAVSGCFNRQVRKVGFVINHGEWRMSSRGELSRVAMKLRELSIEPEEVSLLNVGDELLKSFEVLVVPGPRTDFLDAEIQRLSSYVAQGGHVVVALDPGRSLNIHSWLQQFGVKFDNAYIFPLGDKNENLSFAATEWNANQVATSALVGGSLFLTGASGLSLAANKELDRKLVSLVSTNESVGQSTAPEIDGGTITNGPFLVAALAQAGNTSEGDVVALGDSDFLRDDFIDVFYNSHFVVGLFSQLLNDNTLALTPSKELDPEPLLFSQNNWLIFLGLCIAIPFGLFIGIIVVWIREKLL